MKTLIIHGQDHEGSTCHIARNLAERLGGDTREFFLPRDFDAFCVGCTACFMKSEIKCPHHQMLAPITKAIDEADIIILASPVYVLHATAPMKNLLDHYGWRFLVHRPDERMFSKIGVVISTAAGAGSRGANRDMADSLFWWGVGRIHRLGLSIFATAWSQVTPSRRQQIDRRVAKLARRIEHELARPSVSLGTKLMFFAARLIHKKNPHDADGRYWAERGWLERRRPWHG